MERTDPNSLDLELDEIIVYLGLGSRKPQNKEEEELLKEIKDIEAKGGIVSVPFI